MVPALGLTSTMVRLYDMKQVVGLLAFVIDLLISRFLMCTAQVLEGATMSVTT